MVCPMHANNDIAGLPEQMGGGCKLQRWSCGRQPAELRTAGASRIECLLHPEVYTTCNDTCKQQTWAEWLQCNVVNLRAAIMMARPPRHDQLSAIAEALLRALRQRAAMWLVQTVHACSRGGAMRQLRTSTPASGAELAAWRRAHRARQQLVLCIHTTRYGASARPAATLHHAHVNTSTHGHPSDWRYLRSAINSLGAHQGGWATIVADT